MQAGAEGLAATGGQSLRNLATAAEDADEFIAAHGSFSPGLQEQKRCRRMHERRRDPRGMQRPIQPSIPAAKNGPLSVAGITTRHYSNAQMAYLALLCHYRSQPTGRSAMGRSRCQRSTLPLLILDCCTKPDSIPKSWQVRRLPPARFLKY